MSLECNELANLLSNAWRSACKGHVHDQQYARAMDAGGLTAQPPPGP